MSVAEIAAPRVIAPQAGAQTRFCSSPADFVVYGGQAGGGKSYGLLLDAARHVHRRNYRAVLFRRTTRQLLQPEGLWDAALELYGGMGARARSGSPMDFTFASGAKIILSHMEHEKNRLDWDGSGAAYFGFDEGQHFTEKQFWYVALSRARSRTGIKPSVRLTCNPNPDSFLANLIQWWWDPETGYPIAERSGIIRWFRRIEDKVVWYATRDEAMRDREIVHVYGEPLSLTFIQATLEDNPILMRTNPQYRAKLMSMSYVERERLALGNWKIRETAGLIFKAQWFKIVPARPRGLLTVRYWDKAGTEEEEATAATSRTASTRMSRDLESGRFFIDDVQAAYLSDIDREALIRQTAELDNQKEEGITTWIEREPGSGGKDSARATIRSLAGFDVREERVTGSKITRWRQYSAQAEAGNVFMVAGQWNKDAIDEHRNADPRRPGNDIVDAASGAFNKLNAEALAGVW